jgi:hypothetical protein
MCVRLEEGVRRRTMRLNRKWKIGIVALAAVTVTAVGTTIALASGDGEGGVTGPQADQAIAAALQATGGGTANAVELDSENGATWEVEVTRPDGVTVDVRLDAQYQLVVVEGDTEAADTNDATG